MSKKKKRPTPGNDPNSIAPFVGSGIFLLIGGLSLAYVLDHNRQPEQPNDAAAIILGLAIVVSGILFIAAWAKRK